MKKSKVFASVGLLVSVLALSACNTVEGAGEDISAGGRAIDRSAEKHKNY